MVFDGYQRAFPLESADEHVTIVLIDETALVNYGQWPWPRTRVAELITKISDYGPASIGLDMVFPEPDRFSPGMIADELPILPQSLAAALRGMPSNDERLGEAIRGRHVVLGIAGEAPDPRFPNPPRAQPVVTRGQHAMELVSFSGHIGNVPAVDAAAESRGIMNSGQHDEVVRVIPLLSRVQGAIVPALSVESLRVALDSGIRVDDGPLGLLRLRMDAIDTPIHEDGTVYLRMAHTDTSHAISAYEVLAGKVNPDRIKGKVVLVGMAGLGILDFKNTPLGDFVPGVTLHAQAVENLINGVSLVRPPMMLYLEDAALIVCGLILIWFIPRLSAFRGINLTVAMVLLLVMAGVLAFRQFNVLFDFSWPAIGVLAVFGTTVVGTLSEADRQRRVLRDQAARMAGEVDAARRIQMGLLPDPREAMGEDRRFMVAALLEPARTVGGDFYDCFAIDADHVFFVVADVSGKGLPAALFMASVKSHLKSAALRGGDVGEVLTRAQKEIEHENPEQLFVTAFAAVLEISTGVLEYSSAGHEPPFARTPGGVPERFAIPGGPPLCVVLDFKYEAARRRMQPGEWLCAVTDGATEAMNESREFFGVDRLRTSLTWMPEDVGPADLVRRLREDLQRFSGKAEPADDITLLAIRWNGAV